MILGNATFENGADGWRGVHQGTAVSFQIVRDGTARSGAAFLRARADVAGASIGTDTNIGGIHDRPDGFHMATTRSVGAFAWVRSAPGGPAVNGHFKLWSLGHENMPYNNNGTNFTATGEWSLVACALDRTEFTWQPHRQAWSHPVIRLEFYLHTPLAFLDIDTVMLF